MRKGEVGRLKSGDRRRGIEPLRQNNCTSHCTYTKYIEWLESEKVGFPNLKPSTKTISLRLPEEVLYELKKMARKRDVPYQSLIKMFLKDGLNEELRHSG